jgi:rhamnosyltransferase
MTGSAASVTIAILTYNGERYLGAILEAIRAQGYAGHTEVLVIDSGSSDRTLDVVAAHPEVRLHTIPNSEFGHGRTRALAARLAHTDYVAYLTHDAVPLGSDWLGAILEPMLDDERVVAVMGKQVPRAGCVPILRYEIEGVFRGLGPDFGISVFRDDGRLEGMAERHAAGFYSDVNSAARRDILIGTVPYRDVPYAEDQLFGRDLIERGYRKAYAPKAIVEHSNDLTLAEFGPRTVDEVVGLRQIGTDIPVLSMPRALAHAARGALIDTPRLLRDRRYRPMARLGWLFANPVFHLVKWTAYRRATRMNVAVVPAATMERQSPT